MVQLRNPSGNEIAKGYIALELASQTLGSDIAAATGMLRGKLSMAGDSAGRLYGNRFVDGYKNSMSKISGILTGALAGGAVAGAGFVGWGVKLAAEQEQMAAAYETMLGSREKAMKLMGELKTFAYSTPYDTRELSQATKLLLALGVPAEEVIGTLRRLGDVASGLSIPIAELAELYGKMRTQGRLMSNDIMQLGGRGIPIVKMLAKEFGVAESEVMDLVASGKVGFSSLEKAIKDMTDAGGMFHNNMEVQSKTLNGVLSSVRDQIAEIAMTLGTALMPAIKEMVGNLSESMPQIQNAAKVVGEEMASAFSSDNIGDFTSALLETIDAMKLLGAYFSEARVGVARLSEAWVNLDAARKLAAFQISKDEYDAMVSGAHGKTLEYAKDATMIDPKSGRRVNKTDYLKEHFGERSKQYLEERKPEQKRPIPDWLKEQQDAIKNWMNKDKQEEQKYPPYQPPAPPQVYPPYQPPAPPEKKVNPFEGSFHGFAELNNAIQDSVFRMEQEKRAAAILEQQKKLAEKGNEHLEKIAENTGKFTIFAR